MLTCNSTIKQDILKSKTCHSEGLLILESETPDLNVLEWMQENAEEIERMLLKHGGILLRNYQVGSVSRFNQIVQVLCPNLLDYVYRSTPRTKLGGKIFTATEYPKDRSIPFHNENSYSCSWPKKLFFYSAIVANEGGETPLADSRSVYNSIDPTVREKFEEKGVLYVRNYTSGIDLSWQEVFQTDKKEQVNKYCSENHIEYEWRDTEPKLTTKQRCQASLSHPLIGERVWFNQAHLFHISSLEEKDRRSLIKELGEKNLPRHALYGDGSPLEIEVLDHIRDVYANEKIMFKWKKDDLLILDNILMAHSREPFSGERKVVVAMG